MQIKIHESYRKIVSLADTDLIGKVFEEGIKQIDVRENFFRGEEISSEKAIEVLKDMDIVDATFNLVGKESVQCGLDAKVINKNGVMEIDGVPLALGLF